MSEDLKNTDEVNGFVVEETQAAEIDALRSQLAKLQKDKDLLKNQLQQYKSCFDLSPTGIVIENSEGVILDINPTHAKNLGYQRDELIGQKIHMIAHEEVRWKVDENIKRILSGEKLCHTVRTERKDGKVCYSVLNESKIPLGNGKDGIINVAIDVTELKQKEKELTIEKEKAEAASKAKAAFLANMSHEIRTPINGVVGMTDILAETDLSEDQRDCLNVIQESSNHLLGLIKGILDLSKIEEGQLVLEEVEFNPHELFESTKRIFRSKVEENNLDFSMSYPKDLPDNLIGDPTRINQILMNLISNAIKFTKKGFVEVSISFENFPTVYGQMDKLLLIVEVKDSGVGIEQSKVDQIFEPFTQAEVSTTREFGGTGLGLSICSKLAEMMSGSISVQSEIEKGSTFRVELVLKNPRRKSESTSRLLDVKKVKFRESGVRVLIVEDNVINRKIFRRIIDQLNPSGVMEAIDGKQATILAQKNKFDVIMMDCQMPNMDGYTASTVIRTIGLNCETPIIALTANAMKGESEKCFEAGMNAYLTKPLRRELLFKTFDSYGLLNKK